MQSPCGSPVTVNISSSLSFQIFTHGVTFSDKILWMCSASSFKKVPQNVTSFTPFTLSTALLIYNIRRYMVVPCDVISISASRFIANTCSVGGPFFPFFIVALIYSFSFLLGRLLFFPVSLKIYFIISANSFLSIGRWSLYFRFYVVALIRQLLFHLGRLLGFFVSYPEDLFYYF